MLTTFRSLVQRAAWVLFWIGAGSLASGLVYGLPTQPPIVQFSPDTDTYPQNFAIETDLKSRVYLGSVDGLLVFDGKLWHTIAMPNQDMVRWLRFDGVDRVYVGGYDNFGYVEVDPAGQYQYRELSHHFTSALGTDLFADVWDILVAPDAVFFVALNHVFRYEIQTGHTDLWRHQGKFGPIALFAGKVYLQFRDDAVRVLEGDDWQLLPGTEGLSQRLTAMVNVADKELLLLPIDGEWLRYRDGTIQPVEDVRLADSSHVTYALLLDEHTLCMTTQFGDLIFYDLDANTIDTIQVSRRFLSSAVRATTGELLVVDDQGFYAIKWPTNWRSMARGSGLAGSVHGIKIHGSDTYVLTSSGIYLAEAASTSFDRLDWTRNEAWDLLPIGDREWLLADSSDLLLIDQSGTRALTTPDSYPRELLRSRFDPDVIYVGTEAGVVVVVRTKGVWQVAYTNAGMRNLRIATMIETAPRTLMVGSERGGIQILDFALNEGVWTMQTRLLTAAEGIEYGPDIDSGYLYEIDGRLVASTESGFFHWTGAAFEPDDLYGLGALRMPRQLLELATDGERLWAYDFKRLLRYKGERQWIEEDITGLRRGALTSVAFDGDRVLVGDDAALMVFREVSNTLTTVQVPVSITAATVQVDGKETHLPLVGLSMRARLDRVTFRFALPDFRRPGAVRYRTRVLPIESDFSPWTESAQLTLGDIDAGTYELRVEGRDSLGRISSSSLQIEVPPRWFEGSWMFGVWLVALAGLMTIMILLFGRQRTRYLATERDRLDVMVKERTRALESANKQLEQMAHLDGLTQIPNRRRLDVYLADVWTQCVERNRIMAITIIDVDHFKQFNDSRGHLAGDDLLVALAKLLSRNLRRAEDLVARYGGEEFLVVLPGADSATALSVVESMRSIVEKSGLGVTISAGICTTRPDASTSITEMIAAADTALYQAKAAGRNRVVSG